MSQMNKGPNKGLVGAPKVGAVQGKPLTAPPKYAGSFKKGVATGAKIEQATALHKQGSTQFDNATTQNQRSVADAMMTKAQRDIIAAKQVASKLTAPTKGQTIGTRVPPRPGSAAPTKPTGVAKALPKAITNKK